MMPNHLHLMVFIPEYSKVINDLIGTGKRFMAYKIVEMLKQRKAYKLLKELQLGVPSNEKKKGKKHMVFEPSFDAKACYSDAFIEQKLDYMHHNPVMGKWNLAEDFIDYEHSSAKFYETGIQGCYTITHYEDVGTYIMIQQSPSPPYSKAGEKTLLEQKIIIYNIHDGILFRRKFKDEVLSVIKEEFKKEFGVIPIFRIL